MDLKIFDVEHGQCALLTCDNGRRLMIDCGDSRNWNPGEHLRRQGITRLDMLSVTNYDEDHVSGLPKLRRDVYIQWLTSNPGVQPDVIKKLKSEDGMGPGIDALIEMKSKTHTSGPTQSSPLPEFPGVKQEYFALAYPTFDDENNLSQINYLNINGVGFLFPGDIEKAGWLKLLETSPRLRELLPNISVLVASHHGRKNGICDEIFDKYNCSPFWVVISDKKHEHETQQTVPYYQSKAKGATFRGEMRYVLTTRRDGDITFSFGSGEWCAL